MPAETKPQMTIIRVIVLRADPFEKHVTRHFEQKVADEEDACTQAVDSIAEAEVGLHLKLRKADINAIEVRKNVADEQERDQSPRDLRIDVCRSRSRHRPIFTARINGCALHSASSENDCSWPKLL